MTWNRLKDYLPSIGYKVETKKRKFQGQQQRCYYICGEWHDAELVDNNFLQLVEAKSQLVAAQEK